ncbi:tRNA epoxyqueuosine(34) reductase QueG [Candidatus Venteria ishoeyi]|uniref:Epoxyqueuosine reductase n=1 Tax=Candidatus Venteria ishoeyi TaxID=1899563 RepID=A0A1H6FGE1_9GAMM|nr:tRNA epoxyqueuosine(34) reductase QueG [Candidatus Venteria ishoeyi]SEH09148.1 Epoxyqueuosine reductase [Candidatus Venteria ishoeyi]SEH09277.1 Epoxyqueuosine reductase [Candidatus Venteria ishoeyi]
MYTTAKSPETHPALLEKCLELKPQIQQWAEQLGFQSVGITHTNLEQAEQHLSRWLQKDFHGNMDYMAKHGHKRSRPAELEPGTLRVISVAIPYLPEAMAKMDTQLQQPLQAYVSRYALGRDYHKLLRKRLVQLAKKIQQQSGEFAEKFNYRAFTDSAPVLEKPLAEQAGLGWIGKHSNLINAQQGSWFFLGELYTNLPLPVDAPAQNHCGRCQRCLEVCPTQAIVAPYQVDARLCISYLTIELHGAIPRQLRALIGNRIYGCDDCQLVCPWNRFAHLTAEKDFLPRQGLDNISLLELFAWDEASFLRRTEGSAIRRIGYQRWLRNISVALGNALRADELKHCDHALIREALSQRLIESDDMLREHILWALE